MASENIELKDQQGQLEHRFHRLTKQWKEEVEFFSFPKEMAMSDSYQQIIGMGPRVLPYIFREMEREPDFWFWALRAITGENPVPRETQGQIEPMTEAWLSWAALNGYEW